MNNNTIAEVFSEIADRLEIEGANAFKIRAYRGAVRTLETSSESFEEKVKRGDDLTEISGIGKELAAKIKAVVETGTCEALEKLRGRIPDSLLGLTRIQGLGPKRVGQLYRERGIESVDDLERALEQGTLVSLKGFGEKLQESIRVGLNSPLLKEKRFLRASVEALLDEYTTHLKAGGEVEKLAVAGSYRRLKETIGDLDILAAHPHPKSLMERFVSFDRVKQVLAHGDTKSSVLLRNDLQVDLRVVPVSSFGAALHYFTGSKEHNVALRRRAQDRGLKLNEYALENHDGEVLAGATEDDVFSALDLSFVPPELRENGGEIEAAEKDDLPSLIQVEEMRGDLHMHTTWSDGRVSVQAMAEAAKARGLSYIAITDHSQHLTVANGLNRDRLLAQMDEIDAVNASLDGLQVYKGLEVDILDDGTLDMDDDVLARLDVVIGSVHYLHTLDRAKQTDRMLCAIDHPSITFLGHPSGRHLLKREGMDMDYAKVFDRVKERGIFLEINANPVRLDLYVPHIRMAQELDIPLVINTDAHQVEDLNLMRHGINQARRGWVTARQVVNTLPLKAFEDTRKSTR